MRYFHNPRCSKSREGLAYLEEKGLKPELVLYMKEPLSPSDLETIIDALDIDALELIRKNESIWKKEFADKELEEDELILSMIEYPQLMERPILLNGDKAAIGRPKENFDAII
ncbi:MAG: arsenate reductase (glutaredoxin), partial [Croceimicrobium sp.]